MQQYGVDYDILSGTTLVINSANPPPTPNCILKIYGGVVIGVTGTSGTSGDSTGTSGTSGISGTSGTSGTFGTSGTSGSSGMPLRELSISGTQNNSNRTFILSESVNTSYNLFFYNGQLQQYGVDYTILLGTTLVIDSANPPPTPNCILKIYGDIVIGISGTSGTSGMNGTSGSYGINSTWTISSDIRLKENIETADLDRCYDIVNQLPLKRYKWKDEIYGSDQIKDRSKLGWVAQDVESIFPKAVGITPFKYNRYNTTTKPLLDLDGANIYDENGDIVYETIKEIISEETIEDCRDLNVDQIYAAMYGTIKKLINIVEDHKTQIDILKIEIDNLKSGIANH